MSDVTQILLRIETGDRLAAAELLPLVYEELRRLAAAKMIQERPYHTLQATALVNEAYLRLVDQDEPQRWDSRRHFYAAAAEAMRRILVESARARGRQKRGGGLRRVDVEDYTDSTSSISPAQLMELDDALVKLETQDPDVAQLVRLRLYAGLSTTEAAETLGLPRSTAFDYWKFALSWFAVELNDAPEQRT